MQMAKYRYDCFRIISLIVYSIALGKWSIVSANLNIGLQNETLVGNASKSTAENADGWLFNSKISCQSGHYPPDYCTLTYAYFNHSDRIFYLNTDDSIPNPSWSTQLWPTKTTRFHTSISCHQVYDKAFAFTFFFYYGQSNNFHLHYDTLIPIYSELKLLENSNQLDLTNQAVALMPTVEKIRMEVRIKINACNRHKYIFYHR